MSWPNLGPTHRPNVSGMRGAVACAHPLASLAGMNVLQEGGNAIDAVVAMVATLNVVEPYMSGMGGVGYMTIKVAGEDSPQVLDYMGYAPAGAERERFEGGQNESGMMSSLVPGAVGGWLAALDRYGSMDRARVFGPAIHYAENGFPLTVKNHEFFSMAEDMLSAWETSRNTYLHNGKAPAPSAVLRQPDLARSMRMIVDEGSSAFYTGEIAREIVRFSDAHGGLLTADDLASFAPEWQSPISATYRGYEIYCPAPPCSGIQYLQTLKLVEGFDMAGMGLNSADYIHHLAEAMKLAVADRTAYTAISDSPVRELLSDAYIADRRKRIDPDRAGYSGGERFTSTKAQDEILPGSVESIKRECTTHMVTIDSFGNAVACTQSLGGFFGSGVVYGNTGITLNNISNWYDVDPASPNAIAPHKRIEMPMSPAQVWRDGRLFLMVGTPGSYGIMQTTPQMIMNVIDHGYSIQAAIEAPRFRTMTGYELPVESRIDPDVARELSRRGHLVQLLDAWTPFVGGGQGILVDPESGAFSAGADPRRDGYGLAF
jgi:gamma-glutamyltranspeptidase / glutathione hydrolase